MTNSKTESKTVVLAIEFPSDHSFAVKAGGITTDISISEVMKYDNEGLARLFTYGFGRDVQDYTNRETHALRESGEKFSVRDIIDERLEALQSGEVNSRVRAKPVDPLDAFLADVAREWFKANPDHKIATGYAAIDSKDQGPRKAYAIAFASSVPALAKIAESRHAEAKALAAIDAVGDEFDFDLPEVKEG